MELIRHTIEFIKRVEHGNEILSSLKNEIRIINELTPSFSLADTYDIIEKNISFQTRHSYYTEYSSLQRLCLMILLHQNHSIGFGNNMLYGILVDGSWLWEEYINTLIDDKFYHPRNKHNSHQESSGCQWLFNNNQGLIYPDFIGRSKQNRMVADAKYKPFSNIHSDDYLQILAYMFRFESNIGFFLYPESNINQHSILLNLNSGVDFPPYENTVKSREIKVVKLGLKIPSSVHDFSSFRKLMQCYEEIFLNEMRFYVF